MAKSETIAGKKISETQIQAWADEAEAGFDIPTLKKRGRGRPGRAAESSQVISLRFTPSELAQIDARAQREHKTRSQAIREAVLAYSA